MKLIRLEETEQSLKTMSLAGEDGSSHQKESKFPFRVVTSKSSLDKFLSPPITPMKARAVKSFPVGPFGKTMPREGYIVYGIRHR